MTIIEIQKLILDIKEDYNNTMNFSIYENDRSRIETVYKGLQLIIKGRKLIIMDKNVNAFAYDDAFTDEEFHRLLYRADTPNMDLMEKLIYTDKLTINK